MSAKKPSYTEIMHAYSLKILKLPVIRANTESEFNHGLLKLGYTPNDASDFKLVANGLYCHVSAVPEQQKLKQETQKRINLHIMRDKDGDKFIAPMFLDMITNQQEPGNLTEFYMNSGWTADTIHSRKNLSEGLRLALLKFDKMYR